MEMESLVLADSFRIRLKVHEDERGSFSEIFQAAHINRLLPDVEFVQENLAFSRPDVLRGLHYQIGTAQHGKLLRCQSGTILDAAVDMRRESPTYGHSMLLQLQNPFEWIWLPPGIAHGYLTRGASSWVHYKLSGVYNPAMERGVHPLDTQLNLPWPEGDWLLSPKDRSLPSFQEADKC